MSKKVDIVYPKNEIICKSLLGFSHMMIILLFLIPLYALAQTDTLEVACDTTAFGTQYELKQITSNGTIVALGHRDVKGRKTGRWCHLRHEDALRMEGEYRKDIRVGVWWMNNREFFEYDRKGKIVAKGSGMRGNNSIPF
ncbi:MAG: hypothetical protein IPI00_15420 [Flavobacteriales bacterium]|nr:hypothetical protein [Flavobacteriales bacterium]MBK6945397.1 hypothetical protein [Flavobacteriales bacterium]MBK7241514.1 hypothetical protein [Flavobacteriales bacterium]MBK9535044.1 hypothetical protein [Flavobacteriales bacterium]MBP9139306.1 hypothetical protein [Flavobacteriales bacterium]